MAVQTFRGADMTDATPSSNQQSLLREFSDLITRYERALTESGWSEQRAKLATASAREQIDIARASGHETRPQAPIAKLTVWENGIQCTVSMYAPGLPPGEHDVYLDPSAPGIPGNAAPVYYFCSHCCRDVPMEHKQSCPGDRLASAQKASAPEPSVCRQCGNDYGSHTKGCTLEASAKE